MFKIQNLTPIKYCKTNHKVIIEQSGIDPSSRGLRGSALRMTDFLL